MYFLVKTFSFQMVLLLDSQTVLHPPQITLSTPPPLSVVMTRAGESRGLRSPVPNCPLPFQPQAQPDLSSAMAGHSVPEKESK